MGGGGGGGRVRHRKDNRKWKVKKCNLLCAEATAVRLVLPNLECGRCRVAVLIERHPSPRDPGEVGRLHILVEERLGLESLHVVADTHRGRTAEVGVGSLEGVDVDVHGIDH